MTNKQMAIAFLTLPFMALYFAFAFVLWQIDAGQWGGNWRFYFVFCIVALYGAIIVAIIQATKRKAAGNGRQ